LCKKGCFDKAANLADLQEQLIQIKLRFLFADAVSFKCCIASGQLVDSMEIYFSSS
jgi:hypothetical protein